MRQYNIVFIIFVFATIFTTTVATAQKDLGSESQTVIKDFEAKLLETEKLKSQFSLPALDTSVKPQRYNITPKTLKVDYLPPKLKPVAMKGDDVTKDYNGYVKAGYGIPSSPYLEASYMFSDPKQYLIGAQVKHHSAKSKQNKYQRFATTGGLVDGSYYLNDALTVNGKIGFNRDDVWYYGCGDTVSESRVRQNFNLFDLGVGITNGQKNGSDLSYHAGLDYYALADNFAAKERGTIFSLGATKWFADKHPLTLDIKTDFTTLDKQKLNNIYIQPSFTFHGDAFSILAGVNLVSVNDNFTPLPNVELNVNVLGNQLSAFGGWKGDVVKNTMKSLSNYNPFIKTTSTGVNPLTLNNTSYQDFYGGVKGHVASMDYYVQGGYKPTKGLALFLNETQNCNKFRVLYDTVNITYIKGSVLAKPMPSLEIGVTATQNIFQTSKAVEHPWHLPNTELNVTAAYKILKDKLKLKGELYFQNGPYYLTAANESKRLSPLFDVSLGSEYQISKNFGAFVQINNLINQKRDRWFSYPSYGINVLGGVTARF